MHYEINVAVRTGPGRYTHLFATAERSLRDVEDLKAVHDRIVKAFPAPEFNVTVTQRENVAVSLSEDTLALMFGRKPQNALDALALRAPLSAKRRNPAAYNGR